MEDGTDRTGLQTHFSQFGDPGDLSGWHHQPFVVTPDPELGAPPDIVFLGYSSRDIVYPYIEHENPLLILTVVSAHIGQRPVGLHYDGDPVQLRMTRVKDVTGH